MANFDLTNLAVKMICPNNVVQVDDTGLPSVLVYIPAFKNSDVLTGGDDSTHPAFIVNGFQIPGGVASVQGVVGPRHVAELPKADTVPQQVFQEVGVQQQQAKQQETLEYCQNWYAENENNWFAATALLSALISIKDYEKADALVEKFIDAETMCDDEKELFFGNAQQLYEVQGKEEKARWIEQKINTYKRKKKERQDKIWSELKSVFDFNDEDELPF